MVNENVSFKEYQDSLYDLEVKEKYLSNFHIYKKLMIKKDIYLLKRQLEDVYFHSYELNTLLCDYCLIVEHISSFLKEFHFDNPIEIFSAYSYLIQNGFLSCDKRFIYGKNVADLFPLFGVNVIDGMGVCRHITSFLTDIYKELGFTSYNVSTFSFDLSRYSLSLKDFECDNTYVECYSHVSSYLSYLKKGYNHLVTLVSGSEGTFVIDPTNSLIFYVNQDKKITLLQDENVTIQCGYERIFNYNIRKDIRKYFVPVSSNSLYDLENTYYKVWQKCSYHFLDCNQFYEDHSLMYQSIKSKRRNLVNEFHRYLDSSY